MSTLNVSNITDGTDTVETGYVLNGSAKAWVQITKSSDTINGSLNVSSLTDIAAGQTTVTFTNAMANGSGAAVATNRSVSTGLGVFASMASSGASCAVYTRNSSSTLTDYNFSSAFYGDLA